jgi:hypothetical protein
MLHATFCDYAAAAAAHLPVAGETAALESRLVALLPVIFASRRHEVQRHKQQDAHEFLEALFNKISTDGAASHVQHRLFMVRTAARAPAWAVETVCLSRRVHYRVPRH